jgi:hypothetical protein
MDGVRARLDLLFRVNADLLLILSVRLELDKSVSHREQSVILAQSDIQAGLDMRAVLAHDDRARAHELAVKTLDAEPLGIAVATVAGGPAAFLVSHV